MNPIFLAREIENRYRQYLQTIFYFKDLEFRKSFEESLSSGHLTKGPYLEATPTFKQGLSSKELFQTLLGTDIDQSFLNAIFGERKLYKHQELAIRKVFDNRNIIVATGTGSGKTEAFIYPILLHLYSEFINNSLGPGIRALILYPMNALANDQRERLGEISKRLIDHNSSFQFTFGQYIGETPEDKNDSKRNAADHLSNRLPGELVLRYEMRDSPPHILLTNYSMLEYLLLRPADSPLFDAGNSRTWKFLVLDEVHQYRGSYGIEMAMLMRRLKQRLREDGCTNTFRCIATSATLANGDEDKDTAAQFASNLFYEPFQKEDVVLSEIESIPQPKNIEFTLSDYGMFNQYLESKNHEFDEYINHILKKLSISLVNPNEDQSQIVGEILQCDKRSARFRTMITGKPIEVGELANLVFYDLQEEERQNALANLANLLCKAKDPISASPLISARYHLFIRSLEGAFASYWPKKKIFLDRKSISNNNAAFEVALCRECGQHYFVAQKNFNGGKIKEAIRDPNEIDFGTTFLKPIENEAEADESEEDIESNNKDIFFLCVQCGIAERTQPKCGHNNYIKVIKEPSPEDIDRADQLSKCSACGYTAAGRDPVREVVQGTDGPHSVIATALFQFLPDERKKILAFSDGRQEAAYFAWYLEESYKDILNRNLIMRISESFYPFPEEGISLTTIADRAFLTYRNSFKNKESDDELTIRKNIWLSLYREFLTEEERISLSGVGLIRWFICWPEWFEIPSVLLNPPWSLNENDAKNLLFILLDTMRMDHAIALQSENNISINWIDLNLAQPQKQFRIGDPQKDNKIRSWDSKYSKRARFLAKVLRNINSEISEEEAINNSIYALRAIWESLKQYDEKAPKTHDRLLIPLKDGRQLNPAWWRLKLIKNTDTIYQCNTCGRIYPLSVANCCPKNRCPGNLNPIRADEQAKNHYRILYKEQLPLSLRVEEHTAQLENEKAREFQHEFKRGKINLLSCSTTFELGVDLGDLDTIFLRNVPPEAFNYAQRVGRSGRRSGYPGFAVTYCRRSPHDLYHFSDPLHIIKGNIRPPVLHISNEKIIVRHITAVALSYFFRQYPARFKSVKELFIDLLNPRATSDLIFFLKQYEQKIVLALRAIVPSQMNSSLGLDNQQWILRIADKIESGDSWQFESRFSMAQTEVSSDYKNVLDLENKSSVNKNYKAAEWANKRKITIESEDVLSFLSRKAVIPKYGFPTDVVELDTQKTQQSPYAFEVSLQRDLSIAIAEFAPESKLIANKKEWVSYGLKKVPEREWPRKNYYKCSKHIVFYQWDQSQTKPPLLCDHPLKPAQYIIPIFGFVTNRTSSPQPPKGRSNKVLTTRPYFGGSLGTEPEIIQIPSHNPIIKMAKASPGLMVVLCEGPRNEGFYICSECGAGFRKKINGKHKNYYGQECHGNLQRVSLGHEFITDVLQLKFVPKINSNYDPIWFAFSLAYAILEGAAETLEIPSNDLSVTVAHDEKDKTPIIILYDNVPGGAGLVSQLQNERTFLDSLRAAYNRVSGKCGCDEDTSCYGCLRSYRNQFVHQNLQRGPVKYYLESLLLQYGQKNQEQRF